MRHRFSLSANVLWGALLAVIAFAQSSPVAAQAKPYPEQSIRFVVSFPPGSGADITARFYARIHRAISGGTGLVRPVPARGDRAMDACCEARRHREAVDEGSVAVPARKHPLRRQEVPIPRRSFMFAAAAAAGAHPLQVLAQATSGPLSDRPIKMIAPFAAGSGADSTTDKPRVQ